MPVDASEQPGDLFQVHAISLFLDSSLCKCKLVCLWKWLLFFLCFAGKNNWSHSWGVNLSICRWMSLSHGHLHLAEIETVIEIILCKLLWGEVMSLPRCQTKTWSAQICWLDIWLCLPNENKGMTFLILKRCMQNAASLNKPNFHIRHILFFTFWISIFNTLLLLNSMKISVHFSLFFFTVLWLCHKGCVLSKPGVQRESIRRRARGRVILDDKIPTTCWNSTFLPTSWPLVLWMLVLAGGCVGDLRVVTVVVLNYSTHWLRRCSVIWSFLCKLRFVAPL